MAPQDGTSKAARRQWRQRGAERASSFVNTVSGVVLSDRPWFI